MKIYQIDVEVAATAYIQAKNKDEARRRLKDFIANGLGEMSGPEVSGLRLDDPALPDVSLSPAMTLLGPYENAGFEETNL